MSPASCGDFAQVVTIVVVVPGEGRFWPLSKKIKPWNGLTGANLLTSSLSPDRIKPSWDARGNSLALPFIVVEMFSPVSSSSAVGNQSRDTSGAISLPLANLLVLRPVIRQSPTLNLFDTNVTRNARLTIALLRYPPLYLCHYTRTDMI